jgi:hypothetical protein
MSKKEAAIYNLSMKCPNINILSLCRFFGVFLIIHFRTIIIFSILLFQWSQSEEDDDDEEEQSEFRYAANKILFIYLFKNTSQERNKSQNGLRPTIHVIKVGVIVNRLVIGNKTWKNVQNWV